MEKDRLNKNVLITGAALRIGAACARLLHGEGCNVVLHYRWSEQEALALSEALNAIRPDSARALQADLLTLSELERLADQSRAELMHW